MKIKTAILILIFCTCALSKPLCDSLEDYFKKSKQPGAKRLKKTVTRICTAFDVVKYDGIDPIKLIFPPAEDDDDIGIREEDDLDDFASDDEALLAQDDFLSEPSSRFHFPTSRLSPWPVPPGFNPMRFHQRPVWVSDRRHHREKAVEKIQDEAKPRKVKAKVTPPVNNTVSSTETTVETTTLPLPPAIPVPPPPLPPPRPISRRNLTDSEIVNNDDVVEELDDVDDDMNDDPENNSDVDPVLNDLADFVASVRFLSLNDTRHLSVIFPQGPSASDSSAAVDKISSKSDFDGKLEHILEPALAIEAPNDLLPPRYRDAFPTQEDESNLPEVYRIMTKFSCDDMSYLPGVYADIVTDCQAFHLCLPSGHGFKSATFLCPRNLRYSQKFLRCEWTRGVKCNDSANYFSNNKDFGHNYNTYLQSLHTLLHGDDAALEDSVEDDVMEVTTVRSTTTTQNPTTTTKTRQNIDRLNDSVNSLLLDKLRKIMASD